MKTRHKLIELEEKQREGHLGLDLGETGEASFSERHAVIADGRHKDAAGREWKVKVCVTTTRPQRYRKRCNSSSFATSIMR